MADTRMQPQRTPTSTGIARTTTVNGGRPMQQGPSSNQVTASPGASRATQAHAAQQARAFSGSSHPGAARIQPGTVLMNQAPQRPGGRPPQTQRVNLATRDIFTLDEITVIGTIIDNWRTAESAKDPNAEKVEDRPSLEAMSLVDSSLTKLVELAQNAAQNTPGTPANEQMRAAAQNAGVTAGVTMTGTGGRVAAPARRAAGGPLVEES